MLKKLQRLLRGAVLYYSYAIDFGFEFAWSLFYRRDDKKVSFYNKPFKYTDRFWFIHSLDEIFLEKVYLFTSARELPLIIDCGANIGLSVIFFKRSYPDARIIAFEPDRKNFSILSENLNSFGFQDIELVNKAVWKEQAVLQFNALASVGSRIASLADARNEISVDVPAVALSDYLKEPVDFLKIDIEGAEYEVLLSCKAYLENVRCIFIEYHSFPNKPQSLSALLKILEDTGFRYYIRQAWEQFQYPYVERKTPMFDLQLNIFGYRD